MMQPPVELGVDFGLVPRQRFMHQTNRIIDDADEKLPRRDRNQLDL
jgi:hypothetical protein